MKQSVVLYLHLSVILLSVGFMANCHSTNSSNSPTSPLFDKYFQVPKDQLSPSLKHWTKLKLSDQKKEEIQVLSKAMEHYQRNEFASTIEYLQQILDRQDVPKVSDQNELIYYLGISFMADQQFDQAQLQFDQLEGLRIFKYNGDLLWFKALNHLAKEENQSAKVLLKSMIKKKVKPYFPMAEQLLAENLFKENE
ncbi:MAG: hypothetical protein AAF985_09460 [Bacteroidota bacterium]